MPDVDEPNAIPMFVDESRVFIDNNNATWVCIHKTAGGTSAQNIASYFAATPEMTSTHYVVGQDGTIVQCVFEKDGAAGNCCLEPGHAGYLPNSNLNWWTVSIEHVDPASDNSTPLTDAQKQASFQLIKHICERHNIPMRAGDASGGIIGHHDIAPLSRARCPGNYPFDELFAYLQSEQGGPMVPQGWTDNGTTLTAPNGHTITLGFRDYVLNHNWDSNNLPLEEAHAQIPLELSNPSLGGGTQQVFRWSVLEWTPSGGVFVAWVGQELLKMRELLAQNKPEPPVVTVNTAQAISSIQASIAALQSALHTLEPS